MLMTVTLSVCHAWGIPTLSLGSAGLTALTTRVSVSPLCTRGQLSFQRATQVPVRKKTAGQRIRVAEDERVYIGSVTDPALLPPDPERMRSSSVS